MGDNKGREGTGAQTAAVNNSDETDDPGGVPFDDDFEAAEPPADEGSRTGVPGAPAYDDGNVLQQRGIGYPSSTPVGMTALKGYVIGRWGGADLGCLSIPPRVMRGGTSPSLHNWGMAWDWRWANPGPGREAANSVIQFCLDNAGDLGVQGVHDYEQCKYWKTYNGWNTATSSSASGFGQSWAQWLHIERTWAAANDGRSIEQALRNVRVDTDLIIPKPVIKEGDVGANVARLQDFLRFFRFADFFRSDGEFGPRTLQAVKNAQTEFSRRGWYSAQIDGEFGPRSAAAAKKHLDAAGG